MKNVNKTLFIFTLVILLIGFILYYQGKPILDTLIRTDLSIAIWIIFLTIPYIAMGGLSFKFLSHLYQIQIHWFDWLGLSYIATFLNQLLPYRPGIAVRYLYLHQHYRMTFKQFSVIMFIYGLLTLLCGLLFFAIGLYFFSLPKEFHMTFYISSGIFIFSLIAFFVLKNPLKLHDIIAHPKVLLSAFFIILFSQFIAAFSLYLSFSALHVPVSALNCILMTGLLCIAMIFPITPGNIGILEALLGSYTHIVFNDFTVGFTAMALLRACQWVFTIIFGVFFSIKLIGKSIPSIRTLINVGDKTNIV